MVTVQLESLAPWRARILHAGIAHDPSGDILVAVSDGTLSTAIKCYRVTLKSDKDSCSISCKPTASFYAKCHTETGFRESSSSRVTHVQFLSSESGETLIIGAGDTNMSHVELWSLTNQMAGKLVPPPMMSCITGTWNIFMLMSVLVLAVHHYNITLYRIYYIFISCILLCYR